MDNVNEGGDDFFNIVCGDLGLGEITRSRNYLKFGVGQGHNPLCESDSCLHGSAKCLSCHPESSSDTFVNDSSCQEDQPKYFDYSRASSKSCLSTASSRRDIQGSDMEDFPTYADVPYGTSLRQQKRLYEQQIDSLRRQFSHSEDSGSRKESKRSNSFRMTGKEIETKLMVALEEMEELKIELDACRKRLDAKYKAVAILKEQAELADSELKKTERRASETSRRLEQEVSKLQFELEWRESSFIDSQQTWAERFDRVCQENTILMSKLEARNEELRRANAHKSAIARERDELLALLDVTERLKYEQGKSKIAEEEYGSFSSSELAVLGACKCRVSSPEPCGCAHAAANLRKEVAKLREELELNQRRREESNLTVDAYRAAFEEQLVRSRNLSTRLSQIATMSSRTTKAKAAIKWLIQVLNDDDYIPPRPAEQGVEAEKGNQLPNMSLQELVTVLTDMLHEKNEALAHQKLAAQVLANKVYMYEKMEGKQTAEIGEGTSSRPKGRKHKESKLSQTSERPECDHRESIGDGSTYDDEMSPFKPNSRDNEIFKYVVIPSHEGEANVSESEDAVAVEDKVVNANCQEMLRLCDENCSENVSAATVNNTFAGTGEDEVAQRLGSGDVEISNLDNESLVNDGASLSNITPVASENGEGQRDINSSSVLISGGVKTFEELQAGDSSNNSLESNSEVATLSCKEMDQDVSHILNDTDPMDEKDPPQEVTEDG